ncbi:MAG TPA: MoxR family ATPase [Bacillota bacterium]|nr:MoxR family ATPase [Bacillota bacterium]HOK69180.1 MoxR family ATPase [Bacillota bacterium]HPP85856.1 MoxR family ATPase [Bacillota bacterium]
MNGVYFVYEKLKKNIEKAVVGKSDVVDLAIITLFCGGHLLIDDVPGTGKTLLAKTLAASIDCSFKRIQFTPDLLPADLTGVNYFDMKNSTFAFIPGPVFTNILLADEINRATPKTQAGLLECMEERQVTVEGKTYPLESPFMVIATQNPIDSMGTFPLPEAQLDRFLVRTSMGYPARAESNRIIRNNSAYRPEVNAVLSKRDVLAAAEGLNDVFAHDDIIDYVSAIIEETRQHGEVLLGASPRAGIHLLKVAKGYAAISGRNYVLPDDVKKAAVPVLAHRLMLTSAARVKSAMDVAVVREVLQRVPVPTESVFDGR